MFVPEPARALQWLHGKADPPISVMWWPARSWISCDRTLAVNFGPWLRKGGRLAGTFTTIWSRQVDGVWKWRLDRGNTTPIPLPAGDRPRIMRASCGGARAARRATPTERADLDPLIAIGDSAPVAALPETAVSPGAVIDGGRSADGSLQWEARTMSGKGDKSHLLRVWRWNGKALMLSVFETSDPP